VKRLTQLRAVKQFTHRRAVRQLMGTPREERDRGRPLTRRTIVVGGLVVAAIAVVAVVVLLRLFGAGRPADQARLDVVKTAGTIVVGTGGAVALLLAARRQRYSELGFETTSHDATERRITELYIKAADQLGSDKAPVRVAGLYALERLADGNPLQRSTIVDVLCFYLRMPFNPADHRPPLEASEVEHDRCERLIQETQVRMTAQRILHRHLKQPWSPASWQDLSIDLTNAYLADADFSYADLTGADLGGADFREANLNNANLREAHLVGANLSSADLGGANLRVAVLYDATLRDADLRGADLRGAYLQGADLTGVRLAEARLEGLSWSNSTKWPPELADQIRAASDEDPPWRDRYLLSRPDNLMPIMSPGVELRRRSED
jgi:hypothetical protein